MQLADYAANRGERYLGPVAMSPNVQTGSAPAAAAPAPAAAPPTVPAAPAVSPSPAPAVASPETFAQQVGNTFLPARSLASQGLSIAGGVAGDVAGGMTGPFAPVVAPVLAGGLSAAGEAGQVGLEHLMGWQPAEAGTLGERMTRAGIRGAAGSGVAQGATKVVQVVKGAVGPTLRAAETLAPTLTRELPAEATAATTKVGQLIRDPAQLAAAELTPRGQQTVLSAWWQHHAADGSKAVVDAWDALGAPGQSVLAGPHVDQMSTLVNSMRGGKPLLQTTASDILTQGGPATALWHYGVIPKEVAVPLAYGTKLATENAPRLLTREPVLNFVAKLPQISRVASPWLTPLASAGAQYGAREVLPP